MAASSVTSVETSTLVDSCRTKRVTKQRTCIIGAGAAGIAAAAALSRAGIEFDCFEAGSSPGGMWRYGNDSGYSAYASLRSNTIAENMQWFGFIPGGMRNDYLGHQEVLGYLSEFLCHFGIMPHLRLATRVTRIQAMPGPAFEVDVQNFSGQKTHQYSTVIVATGRHAKPYIPDIRGLERATYMHSCDYRTPDVFAGKRVAIVGFGASGVDIACDAAATADYVALSTRYGGLVTPRYMDGHPTDSNPRSWAGRIPFFVRKQIRNVTLRKWLISPDYKGPGRPRSLSIDKPVVANDRLPELLGRGKVIVRPRIAEICGRSITFEDGSAEDFDLVVFATGYETAFPFFPDQLLQQTAGFRDRYLRVIPAEPQGLFFIGQLSVAGPYFRVFEKQALWVADLIRGHCGLPSRDRLRHLATRESRVSSRRFKHAAQPSDNVDYHSYMRSLDLAHRKRRG